MQLPVLPGVNPHYKSQRKATCQIICLTPYSHLLLSEVFSSKSLILLASGPNQDTLLLVWPPLFSQDLNQGPEIPAQKNPKHYVQNVWHECKTKSSTTTKKEHTRVCIHVCSQLKEHNPMQREITPILETDTSS